MVPDVNNTGLLIIDFESWRPIFRQNFGVLQPYKDLSVSLVQNEHPFWTKKWCETEVSAHLSSSARRLIAIVWASFSVFNSLWHSLTHSSSSFSSEGWATLWDSGPGVRWADNKVGKKSPANVEMGLLCFSLLWVSLIEFYIDFPRTICVKFFVVLVVTLSLKRVVFHTGFNKGKTANCPAQVQQENDKWVLRSTKLEFRLIELYTYHNLNAYAGSVTCFSTKTSSYRAWVDILPNVNKRVVTSFRQLTYVCTFYRFTSSPRSRHVKRWSEFSAVENWILGK